MVEKLLAAFKKYDLALDEDNIDRVMNILRLNDEKHFDYLLQIYRDGGTVITKEMREKLGITNSAVYSREKRLQELGLIEIVPRNKSYYWARVAKLNPLVRKWFEDNQPE